MLVLTVQQIHLDAPLDLTGSCLVLAELVLPRNSIQRKRALREVSVKNGHRSLKRAPFYQTALLKEKVDGRFGLKVSITRPLKNRALDVQVRSLLATAIESGTDLLASLLFKGNLLEDVVEAGGEQLADALQSEEPVFIAAGGIDLQADALRSGVLTIPLKLTKTLRISDTPPGPRAREQRKKSAKTYRKGSTVGEIQLALEAG